MDWSRKKYNEYYNYYMPWIEDKYLGWYGENKTSYSTKQTLKTEVVPDSSVNKLQSGLADGVGGQLDSKGLLGKVGDSTSKEGFNRAERGDTGPLDPNAAQQQGSGVSGTLSGATNTLSSAAGSAGGMLGLGGDKSKK